MKSLEGKDAVPYELLDSDGNKWTHDDSSGLWQLLVFHRHLG